MAFSFLASEGFELRAREVFNISSTFTSIDNGFHTESAGPWSRYAFSTIAAGGNGTFGTFSPGFALTNGVWVAFNWQTDHVGQFGQDLIGFLDDSGAVHLTLARNASGNLTLWRGGTTLLATGSEVFEPNVWHSVEVYMSIADSGGRCIVLVDGVGQIDFTGDTRNAGNAGIYAVRLTARTVTSIVDDFVFGTGGESDAPGTPKVHGLMVSGPGDVTQMLHRPTSVSRWYLPSGDPYPNPGNVLDPISDKSPSNDGNDAQVQPTPDAGWEQTAGAARRRLSPTRGATSQRGSREERYAVEFSGVSANDDLLIAQFVSPPIAAQTISGTVKGQIRVNQLGDVDERAQVIIRVVSGDGGTVRGTLLAMDTGALSSEFAQPGNLINRRFPRGGAQTMSSVAAQDGDRIVVEVGVRHHSSVASSRPTFVFQDDSGTDLPENETSSSAFNPWIEFSNPISLSTGFGDADLVREQPSDDQTYVYETTLNDYDLYQMQDTSGFDSIAGVSLKARARRNDAGAAKLALGVKQGATESFGPDLPLALGFTIIRRNMAVDPTDSGAWTPSKVNSIQCGAKVR